MFVNVLLEVDDLVKDEAADGAIIGLALVQRGVHFDVARQRRVAEKPLAAVAACQRFRVIAAVHGHVLLQAEELSVKEDHPIDKRGFLTMSLSSVENAL